MASPFSELPQDIILEIMNHLALPDHISLLMTCSTFYNFSRQRSFWIMVLDATRKTATIAAPQFARLSEYSLESLQALVVAWLKLQDNWNHPFSRLMQPVTSTNLLQFTDVILAVQGTDIVLLHMRADRSAVCWDVKSATPFPFSPIPTGEGITDVSAPIESYGTCCFVIRTTEESSPLTARRHLVTIRHEGGKALSFDSMSSEGLTPTGPHYESLFVTEDVVGSMTVEDGREHCVISSGSIHSMNTGSFRESMSTIQLHHTPAPAI
ncbi:hypothetical protein B0H15DRAFT_546166 [Mycena belliarum]|uniref:F-box domain-containing protein n=1 Tax=Mycena belliarum TaxID=1033014 RepID=A0AAD6UE22_9AGAR|nr:hypothetical protein B0H15DRAFT_546166 [Mycena belliae]